MNGSSARRDGLLEQLAELIVGIGRPHPVRVAIDGVDAAGKTTLACELAPRIESRGRPVIRASIDGFHRPRAQRYRRGRESALGYYHDSFDYDALRAQLLLPLGPGGDRSCQTAVFDARSDSALDEKPRRAPEDAVLLLDGVFLLRPELDDLWDFRVFVEVDLEEATRRAADRDQELLGSAEEARRLYGRRYRPGQRLYLESVRPARLADVVLENTDPSAPSLRRGQTAVPGLTS